MTKGLIDDELLLSRQDLTDFIECHYATDLDILEITDPSNNLTRAEDSELNQLLQARGIRFEEDYHEGLKSKCVLSGETVVEIESGKSVQERERRPDFYMCYHLD